MPVFDVIVNAWVLLAAVPYLAIAGYDFYLHETDRRVPRVEGLFHGGIAVGVTVFLAAAAAGRNVAAGVALAVLLIAALVDEFWFHGELDGRERRLHHVGGLALAFCIGVWLWTI